MEKQWNSYGKTKWLLRVPWRKNTEKNWLQQCMFDNVTYSTSIPIQKEQALSSLREGLLAFRSVQIPAISGGPLP
jgi:uncharacterized protein (DUF2225 family)